MRIKTFTISYGSFFGTNEELFKKGRILFYYHDDFPFESVGSSTEHCRKIDLSPEQWEAFMNSIKRFAETWEREYVEAVCDGLTWEVKIITDAFRLQSWGVQKFPENLEDFLEEVRKFTGVAFGTDEEE